MNSVTSNHSSLLKILQTVVFGGAILYFGETLFVPLFFGVLVAMVMYPICKWLENRSCPRALAVAICLLIVTILISILVGLLIWQLKVLSDEADVILPKLKAEWVNIQEWLDKSFGINMTEGSGTSFDRMSGLIQSTFSTTVNGLFILFLVPVFTALFLFHRQVFVKYLQMTIGTRHKKELDAVLQETIHTYFNYIKGMILVYLIVGILNSIGLYFLGIDHALLFGMLCAVMTIIPYIGIFVSALLPITIAWINTDSIWYPLGVVAIFSLVQYLEANVIFPRVVGSQLNVSTWATLVAMLAGGILWGVSGMILFIPFVAIIKIITDNVEEWKPLNLLLSRNTKNSSRA